ncbi:Phage Tail Collar domain protein [Erwinia billingiae Eb661]|uniref:Phage Tail Collar domain protein n=1 Tax=Erwinia billingiae (strain Eb661) TaxID=634500 RepID=D8MKJ5_ERWBE|nr:phage tail protein [Erwinia billingiae]CAX57651.1 Phage Tail Collar domain protein [Erwinia billingiae Eb661]
MSTKYYAILTNLGAAKLANAAALGTKIQITQMAVGDGNGVLPSPNAAQTALIAEKRRASLNALSIDENNSSQIIAEQIIPETEGGFWIREIGLFDADNILIAVANCPETYKPQLQEGSGRTQTVRMILIVNSTDAVTVKIDPSVVLATRKYVDEATLTVSQHAEKLMTDHAVAANPHKQYLQMANALSEIKDAGKIADVLTNLGLGAGSALPVGVPLPWSLAAAPEGWLKCNGASFSATTYPVLAKAYPSLKLPDLRGEFIRGWDDGRGADNARALLSAQAATSIRTAALDYFGADATTANGTIGTSFSQADSVTSSQPGDAKSPANGALGAILNDNSMVAEQKQGGIISSSQWISVRPRNVAFNYIVRAA